MERYEIGMEVEDGELEAIFKELETARETIRECYFKLREMGVVTVKKKAASGD